MIASAQIIPPSEQPGRERERFLEPVGPRAQPRGDTIILPSTAAPAGAGSIMLRVTGLKIEGSTVYSDEELRALDGKLIGQTVSLQAVYDLAKRITAKYGNDGYVLSRAVVPPQSLNPRGAVITIRVIEGYVDRVEWPKTLAKYRDFFTHYTRKITAQRPINIRTLERYLLLAGDLPGLKFSTALKPSPGGTGASILVVEVKEKRIEAAARVDNRGTEARGPVQGLVSGTVNNPFGLHAAFTGTVAATTQWQELTFLAGNYRQVFTAEGLTGFVNASYGYGRPGTTALELLEYKTRSTVVEAGLSYPLVRSRDRNLTLSALAFMSNSDSDVLATPFNRDRLRGIRVRAVGDFADEYKGINLVTATFSQGFDGLGSTANDNPFASRAAGRVDFSKIEGSAARLQFLVPNLSAYLAAYGQYAFTSLLVPEQCGFGGVAFGRAFDTSQFLGDHCWQVSGELRLDVPLASKDKDVKLPTVQFYGFSDYGKVYTIAPAAFTPASAAGASVGGGVRLGWHEKLHADLSVARAVEGPNRGLRFFFILAARN